VQGGNFVGKFMPATGEVNLIEVPTPRARPYGIVTSGDGRPWFTEFGSNKLGTVDPETMELQEVTLPREDARPRRLALTSDGIIWYVDYAQGYLGRYDPTSDAFQEWRVPGGAEARPYGMSADDQDRLWFVETGAMPNRFVGFDPTTETFFSNTAIESGGGTVRHMYFEAGDPAVWFGTDENTIGRARLPE
jgi:virginiamycin B lyase